MQVLNLGLNTLLGVCLAPVVPLTLTLLLVRLREAREGTDLAARVEHLEVAAAGGS